MVDKFDRDGDGYVDYKEFIAALWPEKESGQSNPGTDAQKIEDEASLESYCLFVCLFVCLFCLDDLPIQATRQIPTRGYKHQTCNSQSLSYRHSFEIACILTVLEIFDCSVTMSQFLI